MSIASNRGAPGPRQPSNKPPFGKGPRKPLKRSPRKRQKMSADAKVQDAMLGKGRCYVADGMATDCTDGYSERSHIVKQTVISDAFEHGAVSFNGDPWTPQEPGLDYDIPYAGSIELRPLQEILDDTRNIVPACPNHNIDGAAMMDALDVVGKPDGFDDFLAEYGFVFIDNRYWARPS